MTPPDASQADEQHAGAVYRPGPIGPDSSRTGDPLQGGPPQAGHQQAGTLQGGPQQVGPQQGGPQFGGPPPAPHRAGPTPPGPFPPAPHQAAATTSGPGVPGPIPPRPHEAGPATPGPNQLGPNPPGPNRAAPNQPGPNQPAPHQPGPNQPGPNQPGPIPPHQGQPHPGPQQGQQGQQGQPRPWSSYPQPVPGPFPPTIDPRATSPHPQLQQQHPQFQQPPHQGQPGPDPQQPPPVDPYQQLPWVSDGTPTAEEFARRRLAKPAEPTATMGARAILQKGTMGLVRLAPGKREQEYKQDVEMVRRNFGGLRQVTVVNPKGGAGKTVAVLLLAMTFGQKRGGYVLAWDNNETQGTLGMRAQQDFHARTVRDMMRDLHLFRGSHGRVGDLSQYVRAQGEGMFDVLASDESATAGEMLTASAFAEIREIVSRFYKLIFVDTGNNVRAQNWQAAMDATDQLVITMSARNDSAETAARMLDHLEQSGRQRLVRQAVSVVTMPPTRKDIDLPAIQRHFAARTRAVLLAPYEKLIDSGEPLRYGHLSGGTRDSWLKIAAAVAEGL